MLINGPNGVGKSTLLRAAAGEPGSLAAGSRDLAHGAAVFFFRQEAADLLSGERTAVDTLRDAAAEASDERIFRVMKQLGLPRSVQHTALDGLSGGEKARLCIAQMLLSRATLLVCDEPTNHLDLSARGYLQEALKQFDGGVLLASHDRYFAAALCTRVVALEPPVAPEAPPTLVPIGGGYASYEAHLRSQSATAAAFLAPDAERDGIQARQQRGAKGGRSEEEDAAATLTPRQRRKQRAATRSGEGVPTSAKQLPKRSQATKSEKAPAKSAKGHGKR